MPAPQAKCKSEKGKSAVQEAENKPAKNKPAVKAIQLRGVKTHNLKDIDCNIQHGLITVITGPSGSGKSSLAFDTLYAESQRRFLESLSTYARQFMSRFEKPDADSITNILPSIALEQKNQIKNARSTVGTVTEIDDYLRLLFATVAIQVDEEGNPIEAFTREVITKTILNQWPDDTKLVVTVPIETRKTTLDELLSLGYFRVFLDQETIDLTPETFQKNKKLSLIIDRLVLKASNKKRLLDAIDKAFAFSPNQLEAYFALPSQTVYQQQLFEKSNELIPKSAHLFSFNSPLGACSICEGYGKVIGLDLNKVIPNRSLSLSQGAVHPFNSPSNIELYEALIDEAKKQKIPVDIPFEALNAKQKQFVLKGAGQYEGIYSFFEWLESKKYKMHVRVMLAKYRGYSPCHACDGTRLKPEALQFLVAGQTIGEYSKLPLSDLLVAIKKLPKCLGDDTEKVKRLLEELENRVDVLCEMGLGYLTLSRQSRTLSGGESQRIHLASALGNKLTDTLYVLDEPTVGLHAKDTEKLLNVLRALQKAGNTIVVVEHDPDMIMGGDEVIEIGPQGGHNGGYLLHDDTPQAMLKNKLSVTGQAILQSHKIVLPKPKKEYLENTINIKGASGHNLKNIDVEIPIGMLVGISGVSGSGKSTLIKQTLYANYQQAKGKELNSESCLCEDISGLEVFEDVVLVDQSPPGRSQRSNPATYVKAYDEIRRLFASTREAKMYGITASDFSFNSVGGRCEKCEGLGFLTIDMQFMADVTITCPDCQGKRFTSSVLAIEYNQKNIADVLSLTVDESLTFFAEDRRITSKLIPLVDVGLGYLQLGQSTNTLSGGEAQRLKLSGYLADELLASKTDKPYLLIFDEPSTGLHLVDIERLITVFKRLVLTGHSIIVVEHNLEVLAHMDYLIDLGPGGGENGGQVIVAGELANIINDKKSTTIHYLKQKIG